jgi:hypothetical protein
MSDKLVSEFVLRLNRTKTAIADTKKQCDFFKKENSKLEGELKTLQDDEQLLGQIEEDLKVHYVTAKLHNEEGQG